MQEDHTNDTPSTVVNTVVLLDTATSTVAPVVTGSDFYLYPCFSPSGQYIAWVEWDHPSMPWWDTQIRVARFDLESHKIVGEPASIARREAAKEKGGDDGDAMMQPKWLPAFDGSSAATKPETETLFFTSDRTNWSNLYAVQVSSSAAGDVQVTQPSLLTKEALQEDCQFPTWTPSL